jgi:hypothetical protein
VLQVVQAVAARQVAQVAGQVLAVQKLQVKAMMVVAVEDGLAVAAVVLARLELTELLTEIKTL